MFASNGAFFGLSTDTKPSNPSATWTFTEINTGNVYVVVGGGWTLTPTAIVSTTPTTNETLPAGGSVVYVRRHFLTSGKKSFVGLGSIMRIL